MWCLQAVGSRSDARLLRSFDRRQRPTVAFRVCLFLFLFVDSVNVISGCLLLNIFFRFSALDLRKASETSLYLGPHACGIRRWCKYEPTVTVKGPVQNRNRISRIFRRRNICLLHLCSPRLRHHMNKFYAHSVHNIHCLKKRRLLRILNNSEKNEPILIIFGVQNHEKISHQIVRNSPTSPG